MEKQFGVCINYDKAWRAREIAFNNVRRCLKESFKMLLMWFSMLETKNPKTVAHIKTNGKNHFLYCFMALKQQIDGFRFV